MSSAADQPPHKGSADAERVTAAELGEIGSELARLNVLLEREHERAAHREAIIDRLHEDNQRLRRGELQELHEPVRTALYRLHDMIRRESERWAAHGPPPGGRSELGDRSRLEDRPEPGSRPGSVGRGITAGRGDIALDPTHIAPLLTAIADEIAEAVARTGVERFTVKPGDRYDAARHRPVATESVTDPELDGAVVTARTDGFEQGDRVVRRAEVVVGRFTPQDAPQDPSPDPPSLDKSE